MTTTPTLVEEQFARDRAGNLLADSPDRSAGRVEGNRLRVWRDLRFDYDSWGNLARKRKGSQHEQRFVFDAEDWLVAVVTEDAQGVVETRFEYDPIGRRIATSETKRSLSGASRTQRRRFVWQGLRMVHRSNKACWRSLIGSAPVPAKRARR